MMNRHYGLWQDLTSQDTRVLYAFFICSSHREMYFDLIIHLSQEHI